MIVMWNMMVKQEMLLNRPVGECRKGRYQSGLLDNIHKGMRNVGTSVLGRHTQKRILEELRPTQGCRAMYEHLNVQYKVNIYHKNMFTFFVL